MAAGQQSLDSLLRIHSKRKTLRQQLDSASINAEPGKAMPEDLPTVNIGCQKYVLEEHLANKNRKGRRSWIQGYGLFLTEISPNFKALQTYWACSKCDENGMSSLFVATNTTSPTEHLRRSHMITQSTSPRVGVESTQEAPCPPPKRPRLEHPIARSNVNKARELTVGWIITADLPFTAPSNHYLQRILELHDASLATEVPWNRTSVRDMLRKLFATKKGTIASQLGKAITKINLSFDMWTSPNRYAFLALHAHYIDASYTVQSRLLALRRVWGAHTGDNQASTIYDILGEYGIKERIGASVCDNVSSNDKCLESLYRRISPVVRDKDVKANRTRCFGHIINLAARAFLWGHDPESFEREAFTEAAFQIEERELRFWRTRGAVGKLHNVVRFVRASPQRRELMKTVAGDRYGDECHELFEEEQTAIDVELMQNNETRWNSTFLMIQRAIRKRDQITLFITYLDAQTTDPKQRVPAQDHLSPQDWLLLAEIQSLLKPLYEITMRCQGWAKEGRYGALWEVMIGMEYLLNFFEEQKLMFTSCDDNTEEAGYSQPATTTSMALHTGFSLGMPVESPYADCLAERSGQQAKRHTHPTIASREHARGDDAATSSQLEPLDDDHRRYIQISINNCWSKLNEYYTLLEQSPLYPASVILHPRWNVSWLEANWTSHEQLIWLRDAKRNVREHFESHYPSVEPPIVAGVMLPRLIRKEEPSQFDQWIQSHDRHMLEEADELGTYMRQGPIRRDNINPIQWWKDHQDEYPRLSRFALDILAIPAMAVDPERTFSAAKLTITSQRHCLHPDVVEEIQCMRNWLRQQAITLGEIVGFGGHCDAGSAIGTL